MSGAIKRIASDWNSVTERDGKNGAEREAAAQEENAGG